MIVLLAVLGLLVASLVIAVVLVSVRGSSSASPVSTTSLVASSSTFTPPKGAVVLAHEAGSRAVALAAGGGRLTATVLAPSGDPESGLPVSFEVGGRRIKASSCGKGCYTAPARHPSRVDVELGSGSRVGFDFPAHASPAEAIVRRATRVFRRLSSLVYVESLRSSPAAGLVTTWRMEAPDRLSYTISNGASAVVVGNRRWDRSNPAAKWVESSQVPKLQLPAPTWGSLFVNAHVLSQTSVAGRPVWVVSFVNPSVPAWFTAWIDRSNYRTLRLRMTAASHFMYHRYLRFDEPLGIKPPR
jgi:hypothetical protein